MAEEHGVNQLPLFVFLKTPVEKLPFTATVTMTFPQQLPSITSVFCVKVSGVFVCFFRCNRTELYVSYL